MRNEKIKNVLRPWCYKIIPLIYDDSLSYYEVLCKLTHKINEVIDKLNINVDIESYVDEILKEWLEDGTIKNLVNENIEQETFIAPEYISTFCYVNGNYDDSVSYDVIQSFCFINETTAVGVRNARNPVDNNIKLFKFNIETGLKVTDDYTLEGGHCNDVCFDGEKIYIVWMTDNLTGANSNKITVCDSNFNYITTLTLDLPRITGIDYDSVGEKFYIYGGGYVYEYDKRLSYCIRTIDLDFSYYRNYYNYSGRFSAQTISCVDNGFIINYAYPALSVKFNYCGNIVKIYNYEDYYDNGFNTLELEKICYNKYNGWFYVMSFAVQGLGDFSNNTYGRFNLTTGQVYHIIQSATTRPNYYTSTQRVYVSEDVSMNAKMLGTYQYPFKFLQQAIDCCRLVDNPVTIDILNINTAVNLGTIAISNMSNIRISVYPDQSHDNNNYFIPRAEIINCSDIQLFYLNIGNLLIGNCSGVIFGRLKCNRGVFKYGMFILFSAYVNINTLLAENTWFANFTDDRHSITSIDEAGFNSYSIDGTNIELL